MFKCNPKWKELFSIIDALQELNAIGNALWYYLKECDEASVKMKTQIQLTFMFVLIYIIFTNKFAYLDKNLNINTIQMCSFRKYHVV